MRKRYASLADRIIANVVLDIVAPFFEDSPCWAWAGKCRYNRAEMQYGRINIRVDGKHKTVAAHRASVFAFTGSWPPRKLEVLHRCNNSVCVNPAHLLNGTHAENMKQCYDDGRNALCKVNSPCPF